MNPAGFAAALAAHGMAIGASYAACNRLRGGSVRDCVCRLPDGGGWAECPEEARGVRLAHGTKAAAPEVAGTGTGHSAASASPPAPGLSGDICAACGSPNMVRAGTCLLCRDCGSTDGGCS